MTFAEFTYIPPSGALARVRRAAGVSALVAFGGVVLFGSVVAGMSVLLLALAFAAVLAWIAWQWPTRTVIALVVLITLARFISFAAFAATHSTPVLRASQLWKDEIIVVLAVRMVHELFLQRRAPRVHFLDILVLSFIALVVGYSLYPGSVGGSTPFVRALAVRQDALYLLAYFVGRGLTLTRDDVRLILKVLIALSIVIAGVAVVQFAAPNLSNGVLNMLGYQDFTAAIGTPHEVEFVRSRILGSGELPRASSLFLADLGLAFYQVLLVPVAAALFFSVRGRSQVWAGAFLLLMIGTLGMTIARAPLAGAAMGLLVLVLVSRSFAKATWLSWGVAAMALGFLIVSGASFGVFRELFSGEEASASAHTRLITDSVEIIRARPWGLGLGNGSHVSITANGLGEGGLPPWATETWYLQMGLEMGVVALVLFAAMLLTATCHSLLAGLRVRDVALRTITLGTAGAGVGLLFVSAYHPVWAAVQVTFLFWLFAGIAVRAPALEAEWEGTVDAHRARP